MEHRLAQKLSNYFMDKSIISQDEYEIYVYGSELLISFTISTALISLLGLVFNRLVETLIFLTVFIVLRRYTGGYYIAYQPFCVQFFNVLFVNDGYYTYDNSKNTNSAKKQRRCF